MQQSLPMSPHIASYESRPKERRTETSSLNISDKFHFATALNNEAVSLLEEGKMAQGLELFQESLSVCGEAVIELNEDASSSLISKYQSEHRDGLLREDYTTEGGNHQEQDKRPDRQSSINRSTSNVFNPCKLNFVEEMASRFRAKGFIEWTALRLKCQELIPNMDSFFILSCIATYNVALCNQFLGICFSLRTSTTVRRSALMRAVKSYEVVQNMMLKNEALQCDVWMLLNVTNNLSLILVWLKDHRRSCLYSQRLLSILMYISDHEDMKMASAMFEKYLSNVCHLSLRGTQSAAAA